LIYLDTSAIVPYYVPEKLSDVVEQLLQKQEDKPIISQLVEVELFSALSRRVRMGEVSQNDARRITELFENHLNESLYRLVLLENQHYRLARDWISRFDLPLRTLDALHLAVCSINNFSLVTADDKLAQSATILGIDILLLTSKKHPNAKPLHGFSGAGVLEIVDDFDGDTYRAIYTVKFESVIYLLHSFQKKSKHGIATPKQDIELVKKRLKIAQENYLQQTTEKME
jgi:phage-related protein/uncharacterized protein with PIN domain